MHPFLKRGDLPLFFAHRGGGLEMPEATLEAFAYAISLGADVLELDVHYTRDGEIVVVHDPLVDRTTDGSGDVADLDLSTILELDAGYRFEPVDAPGTYPWRGKGVRVPTFSAFLDAFSAYRLNIDIKRNSRELASEVVGVLDDRGLADRVCLATFHSDLAPYIAEIAPDYCRSFPPLEAAGLFLSGDTWLPRELLPYHALQVPMSSHGIEFVTAETVERIHAQGFDVHVWTIDDPSVMQFLIDVGVDGIMTDRPSVLREVLDGQ